MTKEDTSARLKTIMKERNLRQVDILEKAMPLCKKYNVKLNKSDLSQYVAGTVLPGQEKLAILGKALGVSEAWLMGYDVPMERHYRVQEGDRKYSKETVLLIRNFNKLNDIGQNEATKRVEELTYIDKYKKAPEHLTLNAAHAIEGASEEDKRHDEDIMDDDNF